MEEYSAVIIGSGYVGAGLALSLGNALIVEKNEFADGHFALCHSGYSIPDFSPTEPIARKLKELYEARGVIRDGMIDLSFSECVFSEFLLDFGVNILFRTEVVAARDEGDGYRLTLNTVEGVKEIYTTYIIDTRGEGEGYYTVLFRDSDYESHKDSILSLLDGASVEPAFYKDRYALHLPLNAGESTAEATLRVHSAWENAPRSARLLHFSPKSYLSGKGAVPSDANYKSPIEAFEAGIKYKSKLNLTNKRFSASKALHKNSIGSPDITLECDVLCIGAGAAGTYAAYSAKRESAKVILAERSEGVGGMHTLGGVRGYYYGGIGGAYTEDDALSALDTRVYGKGIAKGIYMLKRVVESGVTLLPHTTLITPILEGARVTGAVFFDGEQTVRIKAKMTVDATSDGYLVRALPVKKTYGRDKGGLRTPFSVITSYMRDGRITGINEDAGHVNQYDSAELSRKILESHRYAGRHISEGDFLPLASHTGIREGLSFEGEEALRYEDIILDREPERVLFYAYSDLDKHGHDHALDDKLFKRWWVTSNLATVTVLIPVPLGAVIPKGISGILTAGRCLSADSYSVSAVRMNRDMFRMGECVGVLAAKTVNNGGNAIETDFEAYRRTVTEYGCYLGGMPTKFGFNFPNKKDSFTPVVFDARRNLGKLRTEAPGVCIFSCYKERCDLTLRDEVFAMMTAAEDTLTEYNCAIALGIMGDVRALPVIRRIVASRDDFYFKDCRRSNQFRTASAISTLGELGEMCDAEMLERIVFDPREIERSMYHTLPPDYLYYKDDDRRFVYFDVITHGIAAVCEIYERLGASTKEINRKLQELRDTGALEERIIVNEKSCELTRSEVRGFLDEMIKRTD